MSWFGNTLFPVVEEVFGQSELPTKPSEAAKKLREAGYEKEADYVSGLNEKGLTDLYEWVRLLCEDDSGWNITEMEWCGG